VIGSFAVGGMIYSFSIGILLRLFGQKAVMIGGGFCMAFGIAVLAFAPPWQVQCLVMAVMGLGFYMLHASIQVFVTELAPATRSSAIAFHTFSIFVGQSIGTAAFGYGLTWIGSAWTLAICSVAIALTGIISTLLLTRPRPV
jgi:MFS transporter, DHA1 family, inner membrane transport protein